MEKKWKPLYLSGIYHEYMLKKRQENRDCEMGKNISMGMIYHKETQVIPEWGEKEGINMQFSFLVY